MATILSYPFRLQPNGTVVVVDQDDPAANAEQVAQLVLTRFAERPLSPGFGVTDPTFAGITPTEVVAGLAEYGPPVTVRSVAARPTADNAVTVEIDFE